MGSTLHNAVEPARNCRHCDQIFFAKGLEQFCCSGCEFVFQILNREGLSQFYLLRDANPPTCPLPVQQSSESYDYCDDPLFIEKMSGNGRRLEFFLEGLNCTACLWLLERLPQLCSDAEFARVNMGNSTIAVSRREGGSFAAIARTLDRIGYRPHPLKGSDAATTLQRQENRRDLIRIGIAAGATGNIMILAVSLYAGAEGILGEHFRWLTALLALPVLTYCAWPFYKNTWFAFRTRRLNIDVPIVAAIVAGIFLSIWGLFTGTDTIYFDSLSTLVFLLLSSRFWLKRIQQNHLDVSHLEDYLLMGTVTRLSPDGSRERVSSLSLHKGDLVEITPDTVIPADGQAAEGHGLVHTAVLTGESTPLQLNAGDLIEAGARNLSGTWLLRVDKPAAQSRLAQILKDAEQSSQEKPNLVLFADQVAQWFILVVFALAFGVAAYFMANNPTEGFSRALALVIVTCPCVFGMAIPLSMSLAIRAAAARGIVVKNGNVVERLAQIKKIYFDKTGTLTSGQMQVIHVTPIASTSDFLDLTAHLAAAQALEQNQPHPVARALVQALANQNLPTLHATEVKLLPTGGIAGLINGRPYSIRPIPSASAGQAQQTSRLTLNYMLYCDTTPVVRFEIGDSIRAEAQRVIGWAKQRNIQVSILSGDRPGAVAECGHNLGLSEREMISAATPEEKSAVLKRDSAFSMMVGDGANDAAALASANVGVAVRGSMDVSLRAADVYFTRPDLDALPILFDISKETRKAIIRNLSFSASFNIVSGLLAMTGSMTPLWAAVLMPLSSLTVLGSALWTGRKLGGQR